jgi:hypothetical protein
MFNLLGLSGATIRLRLVVHGPVVECLAGVRVLSTDRTADGVVCDLEIDGLSTLMKVCDLLVQAEVVDINITAS